MVVNDSVIALSTTPVKISYSKGRYHKLSNARIARRKRISEIAVVGRLYVLTPRNERNCPAFHTMERLL